MTSPFPMWMVAPVIGTGCSCGGAGISVGCAAAGRIQAMAVTVRAANLNASGDNNFLKCIIYVPTLVINFLFVDGFPGFYAFMFPFQPFLVKAGPFPSDRFTPHGIQFAVTPAQHT